MATTVFLKDAKLRQLAELIRNHEVNNSRNVRFSSSLEEIENLMMINNNWFSVGKLLDDCNLLVERYKADRVRSPIAGQILVYTEHCLNNALQLFRIYTLRRDYLDKMTEHHNQLFRALDELDISSQGDVLEFVESIRENDNMVLSYMRLNLNSHASAQFSQYLMQIGISFEELVRSNQVKLGFGGRFENLEDEQKLEVYAEILDISGRMNGLGFSEGKEGVEGMIKVDRSTISYGRKKSKWGSAAMFLMDIGLLVWDVYSSAHTITEAARTAVVAAAEAGGAALGTIVGAAAARLTGQAATSVFVTAVGLVASFVGSFIFGAIAGFLFNLIFGSGGERPLPTEGFTLYVAPMPNGHELARQIY